MRPRKSSTRHPLVREIIIVLAFKAVVLVIFYTMFFGPAHRPDPEAGGLERSLFGTSDLANPPQRSSDPDV